MRFYARMHGADEEKWAITGLLHDLDYEKYPKDHPLWAMKLLEAQGWDNDIIRAIGSHNRRLGIARKSSMERHLFACDELCGFITAVTYVRPSKSIHDVETKSVLKKIRTSGFAAAVSREDIYAGAEEIGVPLDKHIENVIKAMQMHSDALGLTGTPTPA